ncbi:DUF3047 domain-containing protein [Roseomonas alkaliterrae]|uniref:DUF3047 domain-containing protein n=1 Tax=Neoroseomonas alkaliterrae TaxID=1452450 RepID=A0A840Y2H9_9PROT|nr:DUF3047 domain-containing protein [Neoroseomonas alkaliterrae]MBB5690577.1 hypothetical protein [Neoroseomonas alkaliterrae]MBR0675873.1 DUF3047 domain-containing protein [Neoroseomonas alkaliterrae]
MRGLGPIRILGLLAVLALAGGTAALARAPEEPWQEGRWAGIAPLHFSRQADGTIAVSGRSGGSFIWRYERRPAGCLTWRWRVDDGPPPTRLDRRGGDDRALSITIGFAGWPETTTGWQRVQHAMAQSQAGGRHLPRAAIVLVWGGTGEERQGFSSPYMAGLGRVWVLRRADAPRGTWFEERVDLAALWRQAFGGEAPPIEKIAISSDVDDTGSRIEARIEGLRFGPCPRTS